jgi:hypothetical protein
VLDGPAGRIDVGIIIGFEISTNTLGMLGGGVGLERVFDLYNFEEGWFMYGSSSVAPDGLSISLLTKIKKICSVPGSVSGGVYLGLATGWSNYSVPGVDNYAGFAQSYSGGVNIPGKFFGPFGSYFQSADGKIVGATIGASASSDKLPFGVSISKVSAILLEKRMYHQGTSKLPKPPTSEQASRMAGNILSATQSLGAMGFPLAVKAAAVIAYNAIAWRNEEAIKNASVP